MSKRNPQPYLQKLDRFDRCYSLPHQQKRHYWGLPNTNFGFYTSQQLQEIEKRTKSIKTETSATQRYVKQVDGKFIVSTTDENYVHCCTCHNNPKRYVSSLQRCKFCQEFQQGNEKTEVTRNSLISRLTHNPEANEDYTTVKSLKTVDDKAIQVQLKLPSIFNHNKKQTKNCRACKEKKAILQTSKVKKRYLPREKEGEQAEKEKGTDSLLYSFSAKKPSRFRF